ncbi:MAG TPA: glycosyltransferase, partial [Nitrospirae bacterium]|nr:glycosyltransferase [Nitrospirota bacterium]
MKSVVLGGYYGFGNLGDELILKNIVLILKNLGFEHFYAISDDLDYSFSKHKAINFIKWNDYKTLNETVKNIDIAILGGGGLFQDYDRLDIYGLFENRLGVHIFSIIPILARIHKKPVAYLFNGVGPLFSEDSRKFTSYAYSISNFISVRDNKSRDILEGLGFNDIVVSIDPVFYSYENIIKKGKDKPIVGLSLRQWLDKRLQSQTVDAVAKFIKEFADKFDFTFVSFQDHDNYNSDTMIYKELLSRVDNIDLIQSKDYRLDEIEEIFGNFSFFIGMRFHSIILSLKYKIPFIAISYWNKVEGLLSELGLLSYCIDIQDTSGNTLTEKFLNIYNKKQQVLENIESSLSQINQRMYNGIEAFREFLTHISKKAEITLSNQVEVVTDHVLENYLNYKAIKPKHETQFYKNRYSHLQLDRILKRSNFKKIIFYPSPIYWDIPLFQRPHQLFREFSKRGYLVFFLTPEPELDHTNPIREINENLYLIKDVDLLYSLKDEEIILWISWTVFIFYRDLFKNCITIYDCIDELDVFPYYSPFSEIDHYKLLNSSDLVITTSSALLQEAKKIRNDAILAPNGVFIEDFVTYDDYIPEDMKQVLSKNRPIVGFYGLIAEWRIDYNLLNSVVEECKDYSFILIGPCDDSHKKIKPADNLFILGPKKYDDLKYYLKHFDVAIIPYKIDRITRSVFPVKLCEYLAAGKIVVSTTLPECKNFKSVLTSENQRDFSENIKKALSLKDSPDFINLSKKEAMQNTWQRRVDLIEDKIMSIGKNTKKKDFIDQKILIEEAKANVSLANALLVKNFKLFEDFKTAISDRDKTWLQLNRVIDEKEFIRTQLDSTKSQLDSTK